MGFFRTVHTTRACRRCGDDHPVDVQFKTGEDWSGDEYRVGDVASDITPGVFEGMADAYCATCMSRWVEDEKRVGFELLAVDVAAQRIVARRATWRHGALDGRPELGLVLTLLDTEPMSADRVRALAETPEGFGWPTFVARLHSANVAIWLGAVRVLPTEAPGDAATTAWWRARTNESNERLRGLGWPGGGDQWIDVAVRVDADHRVRLEP